jgi:hypothetical protein
MFGAEFVIRNVPYCGACTEADARDVILTAFSSRLRGCSNWLSRTTRSISQVMTP